MQKIFLEKYELVVKAQQRILQLDSVSCFKSGGEKNLDFLLK